MGSKARGIGGSLPVLLGSLLATGVVAVLFAMRPDLDLTAAAWFVRSGGGFVGDTEAGRTARHLFESVTFLLVGGLTALYALRRLGGVRIWAPNGVGLVFVVLSLALGPGLLVNEGLKNHSHRPRPAQVTTFGGPWDFRPFYRFDGACERNCSFVSGEGATAFWTLAPALLCPPPYQALAIAAAVAFGAAASLLRMAFGGHFLSDSLFAGLFAWLVILGCWRLTAAVTGQTPGSYRG